MEAQGEYSWALPAGGNWDTTTNAWTTPQAVGGPFPWSNGLVAVFGEFRVPGPVPVVRFPGIFAGGLTFRGLGGTSYGLGGAGSAALPLSSFTGTETISADESFPGSSRRLQAVPPLRFTNDLRIANLSQPGAATLDLSGTMDRFTPGGRVNFDGTGTTLLGGSIGSNVTGGLTKNGTGTLVLGASVSTFGGPISLNQGVVVAGSDTNFGLPANTLTLGAATLRLLEFSGTGRTLFVQGGSSFPSRLVVSGAAPATFSAAGAWQGGVGSLLQLAAGPNGGSVALDDASDAFFGTLEVGSRGLTLMDTQLVPAGGLDFRLQNAGRISNLLRLTLHAGAQISVLQPPTALTGRVGAATALEANGPRVLYRPSANGKAALSESLGLVTLRGLTTLVGPDSAGPSAGTSLIFGNLLRKDHATLALRGASAGPGRIGGEPSAGNINYLLTGAPPLSGRQTPNARLVPWAVSTDGPAELRSRSLVTYDRNGLRPLDSATETADASAGLVAAANNDLRGTLSGPGTVTVNSLLNTTGTPQLLGAGVITVTDGAVLNRAPLTVSGPTLNFPNGGFLHPGAPVEIQGASVLSGANGLVISSLAGGQTPVRFSNAGPNLFTGGLFLQGAAQLFFTSNAQLGQAASQNAGAVTLGGGQLIFQPAAATTATLGETAPRNFVVNEANGVIGTAVADAVLEIPGQIRGAGQLQFGGGAASHPRGIVDLTRTEPNPYTGGTVIAPGILRVRNAHQLGQGSIILRGGTLQAGQAVRFTRPLVPAQDSVLDTQGFDLALAAGVASAAVDPLANAGPITLTKTGSGSLTLTAVSGYGVNYIVQAGTFTIGQLGSSGSLLGDVDNAGMLVFRRNDFHTYRGAVSGIGDLVQLGGTLNLLGASPATGFLRAQVGRVLLDGSWAGGFVVSVRAQISLNGGTLAGSGAKSIVAAGGTLDGSGLVQGNVSNSGEIINSGGGALRFNGILVNQSGGIVRATLGGTVDLSATGAFVNLGVIDRLNGTVILPADFANFGVVLEPGSVAVRAVSRVGTTVTLQVTGYLGHTYRLQRSTGLQGGAFVDLGASQTGNGGTLTFIDQNASGNSGFYRVVVD